MMRRQKTSAKTKLTRSGAAQVPPVRDRRIVLVDERPLREKAAHEFRQEMVKLEEARTQWRAFEHEDQPAFARWMAQKFGPLLTELREQEREIHELEELVHEIDDELYFGNAKSPQEGYQRVMRRRADPEAFAKEEGYGDVGDNDVGARGRSDAEDDDVPLHEVPETIRRQMFETFVAKFSHVAVDDLSPEDYEQLYQQFDSQIFGGACQQHALPPDTRSNSPHNWSYSNSSPSSTQSRIKEIYRILVRRLHPDRRSHPDTEDTALWHEVQEAYAAHDLNRLETLWALTEMQEGSDGQNASLFQIERALKELKRGIRALHNSLKKAQSDPAWGFSTRTNTRSLEKKLRQEMVASLAMRKFHLFDLRRMVDEASRPITSRRKKKAKKKLAKKASQDKAKSKKAQPHPNTAASGPSPKLQPKKKAKSNSQSNSKPTPKANQKNKPQAKSKPTPKSKSKSPSETKPKRTPEAPEPPTRKTSRSRDVQLDLF